MEADGYFLTFFTKKSLLKGNSHTDNYRTNSRVQYNMTKIGDESLKFQMRAKYVKK